MMPDSTNETGRAALAAWLARYVDAWRTNDPADITERLTQSARYLNRPGARPRLKRPDPRNGWTTCHEILGMDILPDQCGTKGVVQGWTTSTGVVEPVSFDQLWVTDPEDDGRASVFTEWWMRRPQSRE